MRTDINIVYRYILSAKRRSLPHCSRDLLRSHILCHLILYAQQHVFSCVSFPTRIFPLAFSSSKMISPTSGTLIHPESGFLILSTGVVRHRSEHSLPESCRSRRCTPAVYRRSFHQVRCPDQWGEFPVRCEHTLQRDDPQILPSRKKSCHERLFCGDKRDHLLHRFPLYGRSEPELFCRYVQYVQDISVKPVQKGNGRYADRFHPSGPDAPCTFPVYPGAAPTVFYIRT